jgi:cell shape-determining protein MreD
MLGFASAIMSLLAAMAYLVMKLLFWYDLPIGIAPIIIGLFFVSSVQLFFLGVLGEYVGSIYTYVRSRPLVVELERINFDDGP